MPSQRLKGFTVFKGLEGFKRLERLEGLWPWDACWLQEGWQTADLDAHKKPLMCGPGVPVGCKSGHKKPLMCGLGVAVGCKSGHKKRLMCGAGWLLAAGVAVGCRMKHAKSTFEGFYGF